MLKEKLDKRAQLVTEARGIVDKVDKEEREMTAEENEKYEKILGDVEKLFSEIDKEQRLLQIEANLSKASEVEEDVKPDKNDKPTDDKEFRTKAFRKFLRGGMGVLTVDEKRALSAGTDDEGGYTIPPQEFVAQLLKDVDDLVFIRQAATKFTLTKSESMGAPTLEEDPADADWTTELATGSEDSDMEFGKRELEPNPFAKRIKISKTLIRRSALNIEDIVRQRLAYKFSITEEKAYMTGNGTGKPLGIFTASADGIPTSRDVSEDNSETAPTFDGLINAKYSLKEQYLKKSTWMFHRDCLKILSKIKDSENRYTWEPSVQMGQPDRLLNRPIYMSEYAPNTFTAGQYVGAIGDFSFYWIVDSLDLQMQRLVELYAETNQIGYIARKEGDGAPVMPTAFARVQLASGS